MKVFLIFNLTSLLLINSSDASNDKSDSKSDNRNGLQVEEADVMKFCPYNYNTGKRECRVFKEPTKEE